MNVLAAVFLWVMSGFFYLAGVAAQEYVGPEKLAELPPNPFYIMAAMALVAGIVTLFEDKLIEESE